MHLRERDHFLCEEQRPSLSSLPSRIKTFLLVLSPSLSPGLRQVCLGPLSFRD